MDETFMRRLRRLLHFDRRNSVSTSSMRCAKQSVSHRGPVELRSISRPHSSDITQDDAAISCVYRRISCDSTGTTRHISARYASTDAADGSIVLRDIELVGFRYRTKLHRPAMKNALFSAPHGGGRITKTRKDLCSGKCTETMVQGAKMVSEQSK